MAAVVAGRPARRGRGPRIGVSLSREALCAAIRRPGESRVQPWRAALAPLNGDGTPWSGLTEALRVDGGRLVGLRRFRGGAADAALIAEASSNGSGPLSVVGSPDVRRELSRQLASLGVTVDTPTSAVTEVSEHADLLAAVFAGPDASPQLITDAARAGRAMRIRRMSMYVGAAAAVIALLGGSFELWGAHRELANIRVQTAALAPQLRLTTAGNTTVTTAFNQLKVLATAERTAPHYSSVIAAVSEHLPTDAYLTGFHATLDSVRIDGHAAHASRVIDELVHTPGLSGAQSTSPTRVVKEQDGPPRELFVVGARLVQRGVTTPPPAVAPRGAGGRR